MAAEHDINNPGESSLSLAVKSEILGFSQRKSPIRVGRFSSELVKRFDELSLVDRPTEHTFSEIRSVQFANKFSACDVFFRVGITGVVGRGDHPIEDKRAGESDGPLRSLFPKRRRFCQPSFVPSARTTRGY